MTKELKPCPFCGGGAQVIFDEESEYWKIRCKNSTCDVKPSTSWSFIKEETVEAWNRREPIDRIVEQLEESKAKDGLPADIVWNNALRVAIEIVKGDAV